MMDVFKNVTFHLSGDIKTTTLSLLKKGGAKRSKFLCSSVSVNIVGDSCSDSDDNDVEEANEVRKDYFFTLMSYLYYISVRFGEYLISMKIGLLKVSVWVRCYPFSLSCMPQMTRYDINVFQHLQACL